MGELSEKLAGFKEVEMKIGKIYGLLKQNKFNASLSSTQQSSSKSSDSSSSRSSDDAQEEGSKYVSVS